MPRSTSRTDSKAQPSELARWKDDPYPQYRDEVNASIAFSGLSVDFFTEGKARHLAQLIGAHFGHAATPQCLDVGCGLGAMHPHLQGCVGGLIGVDVSDAAISGAAQANPWASYRKFDGERLPFKDAAFDVAFASCVLHHVEPASRARFMREIYRVLRPGGLSVIFEHNPINPLTRLAVYRCEFDRDAVLLRRREALGLIGDAGFQSARGRYIFFLPLRSRWARALDDRLGSLALGAQYYVCGTRPGDA